VICRAVPSSQGAIRLVRVAGIQVFLHWSWFVVAVLEVQLRTTQYRSIAWNVAEYLALFAIVTLHEFGHALACRQVGGRADTIVLWPLGGVAYVDPPQRPGATLWSLAAGPLVNVVLVPVFSALLVASRSAGLAQAAPDAAACLRAVAYINLGLLLFNLLPVYPLDGGQILRSLLWFVLGRARSLTVASSIGFLGVLALLALALASRSVWFGILAAFVGMSCWRGFQQARALARLARLPRRAGVSCPSCRTSPPVGAFWGCGRCGTRFDTFETSATCPACGATFTETRCVDCGRSSPLAEWLKARAIA
jgi:Zn-dependent protease